MKRVQISYPKPILSPNYRAHGARKGAAGKKHREEATWAAKAVGVRQNAFIGDEIKVHLVFHPRAVRKRDQDNAIASMKWALDGISNALGVDDSLFRITAEFAEPRATPCVYVEIGL